MEITTLCYIEKNNQYLMLNRVKKKEDINKGKWIGVGGHFNKGETPNECVRREVYEETGLTLKSLELRGILTFIADKDFVEYIWLYTSDDFEGELIDCNEGILKWIDKEKVKDLELWEGDRVFLKLLEEKSEFFSLKLEYEGNKLMNTVLE